MVNAITWVKEIKTDAGECDHLADGSRGRRAEFIALMTGEFLSMKGQIEWAHIRWAGKGMRRQGESE